MRVLMCGGTIGLIAVAGKDRDLQPALGLCLAGAGLMTVLLIAVGGVAVASAEVAKDKMKSAPARNVFLGLLARTITGSFTGALLAPRDLQFAGATLGIGAAIGSSYVGLATRKWAMQRWGQATTGFIEHAVVLSAATAITDAR